MEPYKDLHCCNVEQMSFTYTNVPYIYHTFYINFKNSLIIHEQNTKEIIAVKESLCVIKQIFTKLLPRFSRLIQHVY